MPMPKPRYDRAPSEELLALLRACTTLLLGEGYTRGPDVVLGRPTRAQQCYPTDLTAAQWAQWAPPAATTRDRTTAAPRAAGARQCHPAGPAEWLPLATAAP